MTITRISPLFKLMFKCVYPKLISFSLDMVYRYQHIWHQLVATHTRVWFLKKIRNQRFLFTSQYFGFSAKKTFEDDFFCVLNCEIEIPQFKPRSNGQPAAISRLLVYKSVYFNWNQNFAVLSQIFFFLLKIIERENQTLVSC